MGMHLSFAQTTEVPWVLRSNEDGINVYTRPNPSSPFDEVKVVAAIVGKIESAYNLLSNPIKLSSTDPYAREAKILQVVDSTEMYFYQKIQMPFFMKDRDAVVQMNRKRTANGYFLTVNTVEGILPPVEGLMRETGIQIYVSLQSITPETFELTYKLAIKQTTGTPVSMANKIIAESTAERVTAIRSLITSDATAER